MVVNELQEAPSGKPWERSWIRDWRPTRYTRAAYDEWAAERQGEIAARIVLVRSAIDPLLQPTNIPNICDQCGCLADDHAGNRCPVTDPASRIAEGRNP